MNLLERVFTLLRANLNTVVEKADDPEKALRQLQIDMRNQLVQVKTQVATAIAENHRLQKRSQEKKAEAETWLKKAEQAVHQGHDDVARSLLTHYNSLMKQVQRYQQSQKEQEQLVVTMRGALRQLEAKFSEIETTLDLLAARKRNALIQQRVFEALNKTEKPEEREHAEKVRDAVLNAEARARALADLQTRDLSAQLDQLTEAQIIERQINGLKEKKRLAAEQSLRYEVGPQTSPLPQLDEPDHTRVKKQTEPLSYSSQPDSPDDLATLQQLLDSRQNPSTND